MIVEAEALEVTRYTEQYELLRAQFIGATRDMAERCEARQPRGIGLALLLREGIPGWLEAVEAVLRASLVPRATETWDRQAQPSFKDTGLGGAALMGLPSAQRHDIATLLASLVLSTRRLSAVSPGEGYRPC